MRWAMLLNLNLENEITTSDGSFNVIKLDNRNNLNNQINESYKLMNREYNKIGFIIVEGEKISSSRIIFYHINDKYKNYTFDEYLKEEFLK